MCSTKHNTTIPNKINKQKKNRYLFRVITIIFFSSPSILSPFFKLNRNQFKFNCKKISLILRMWIFRAILTSFVWWQFIQFNVTRLNFYSPIFCVDSLQLNPRWIQIGHSFAYVYLYLYVYLYTLFWFFFSSILQKKNKNVSHTHKTSNVDCHIRCWQMW